MDKINPEMVKPVITGTETADKTGGDYRRTSGKSSRKKNYSRIKHLGIRAWQRFLFHCSL